MDIQQRTDLASKTCQYFDKELYPACMGQKNMPRVNCDGQLTRCEIGRQEPPIKSVQEAKADFAKSMVNHPAHYNIGSIECIDALAAATSGLEGIEAFCTANAIKYLWRWKWKNGAEDLDKAIWYIERLKSHLGKNN